MRRQRWVQRASTIIIITVTSRFHNLFRFSSKIQWFFQFSTPFTLWSVGTVKIYLMIRFFSSSGLGDPFVFQSSREFLESDFQEEILVCIYTIYQYGEIFCFLHCSQCITFPTQLHLFLIFIFGQVYSFIMWLITTQSTLAFLCCIINFYFDIISLYWG